MFLYKHFIRGHEHGGRDAEAPHHAPGRELPELDEVERDVERNLWHILNTRRGHGYFLKDYGLTDVNLTSHMVEKLKDEIWETIGLYEPRVELLEIDEKYEDERAHLVLKLRVIEGREKRKFTLDMTARSFLPDMRKRDH